MDIMDWLNSLRRLRSWSVANRPDAYSQAVQRDVYGGGFSAANRPDAYAEAVQREVYGRGEQPEPYSRMSSGTITPMAAPAPMRRPARASSRRAPDYDYEAMDRLTEALSGGGITEGQNRNIDDETRLRALAQIARLYG